jgi:hypothetical protein
MKVVVSSSANIKTAETNYIDTSCFSDTVSCNDANSQLVLRVDSVERHIPSGSSADLQSPRPKHGPEKPSPGDTAPWPRTDRPHIQAREIPEAKERPLIQEVYAAE